MDSGHLIGHLINIDGKFMSFVEFKGKCPAITKNKLFNVRRDIGSPQRIPEGKRNCFKKIVVNNINQKHGFILKREINLFSL